MRHRGRDAASHCNALAKQAGAQSLSGPLGWAEGALKRHPRKSGGDTAIELLCELVYLLDASILVGYPRSSGMKGWTCDRHYLF